MYHAGLKELGIVAEITIRGGGGKLVIEAKSPGRRQLPNQFLFLIIFEFLI
jgi:hypothetical protein